MIPNNPLPNMIQKRKITFILILLGIFLVSFVIAAISQSKTIVDSSDVVDTKPGVEPISKELLYNLGGHDLIALESIYFDSYNQNGYDLMASAPNSNYVTYFKNNSNSDSSVRFEKDGYFFTYDLSGGDMKWTNAPLNPGQTSTPGGYCQGLSNSQNTQITYQKDTATYAKTFCNTSVEYKISDNMLKETFILYGLPSIKDYIYLEYSGNIKFNKTLDICANDVCYTPQGTQDDFETSGKIYFKDTNGKTIFFLKEPIITDSAGNSVAGVYSVHGSNAQMNFWLRIPTSFIRDATFPIFVDPTIQTVELASNIGWDSSIALDSLGYAHISEYDFATNKLKYCNNTAGTWSCTNILSNAYCSYYGTSIAVDSNDKIHISSSRSIGGLASNLTYCNNVAGWTCANVYAVGLPIGRYSSIAIDSGNVVHISSSYIVTWYLNNTGGVWSGIVIDWGGLGTDSGYYSSIAIDSADKIHMSYYNSTTGVGGKAMYCNNTAGSWSCTPSDTFVVDVGRASSIAIDSADKVHVSHQGGTTGVLRYCNNIVGWSCETVDALGGVDMGRDTAIVIDYDDKTHISHYDSPNDKLRYCNNTAGSWSCSVIANLSTFMDLGNPNGRNLAIKAGRLSTTTSFSGYYHISYYNNLSTSSLNYLKNLYYLNPPGLNIVYPTFNNTNTTDVNQDINYTTTINPLILDIDLDSCWYSNDTYSKNTSLGTGGVCQNITGVTWSEGKHNVTIYVNSTGNGGFSYNFSTISFTLDNTVPAIYITSPANNSFSSNNGLDIEYLRSDLGSGLFNCWYSNDTYDVNISLATCDNITTITWIDGQHNVTIWANDTLGNYNWTSVTFTIDTVVPNLTIIVPANLTSQTSYDVFINATGEDNVNISYCGYNVTRGTLIEKVETQLPCEYSIITPTFNTTTTMSIISTFVIHFNVKDNAGNLNTTSSQIDITGPPPGPSTGGGSSGEPVREPPKNLTFCGDGICQKGLNDYGFEENFYTCGQDCQEGFNIDEFIYSLGPYCWDRNKDGTMNTSSVCFWKQGIKPQLFSIGGEIPPFNYETAVLNCFDSDEDTKCFWNEDIAAILFFFIIVITLILSMIQIKDKTSKKALSIPRYIKVKLTTRRKKWGRR